MDQEKKFTHELMEQLFNRVILLELWNRRLTEHALALSGVVLEDYPLFGKVDEMKKSGALNDEVLLHLLDSSSDEVSMRLQELALPTQKE